MHRSAEFGAQRKRAARAQIPSDAAPYRIMTDETPHQNDSDASLRERTLAQLDDPDRRRRYKALTDLNQTHLNPREWSR